MKKIVILLALIMVIFAEGCNFEEISFPSTENKPSIPPESTVEEVNESMAMSESYTRETRISDVINAPDQQHLKLRVPERLLMAGRTFAVLRVHDGETVLLPDLDNDANTVTIETDRFSTYALVYRDNASAADGDNPSTDYLFHTTAGH